MARPQPFAHLQKPDDQRHSQRRRVLLLGNRGPAQILRESLEEAGFEVESIADYPSVSAPDAVDSLKARLARFRSEGTREAMNWFHPGISPWAERPELPAVGQEFGIQVIAPPARTLSLFGNRLNLLGEAEKLSIPNLLLSADPLHSVREIDRLIRRNKHCFPFVLKTVRGGSTFGLRVIHEPEDLGKQLGLWIEQLRGNLGEVMLLAERYLEGARRVVQPFARLADGSVHLFPMTDASLQCRFRKVVEFGPGDHLEPAMEKQTRDWTTALATQVGFLGVGILEFLVDGNRAYLIEGMARLNTDFHLWEKLAETRAVSWQFAGLQTARIEVPASTMTPSRSGLAIRIYAEDSLMQLPQPGMMRELITKRDWNFPGAEARYVSLFEEGEEVHSTGNGLLGQLWVFAEDRKRALTVARGVLDEIWIAGSVQANDRFLLELISHPWVLEGMFHAGFVDEEFIPSVRPSPELMRLFASLCASLSETSETAVRWAVGDQWIKPDDSSLRWQEAPTSWTVEGFRGISGVLELPDGKKVRACAYPLAAARWQVRIGKWVLTVKRVRPRSAEKSKSRLMLSAQVAGRVHSILFREQALVPAHEPILMVESLGMLIPHALPLDARISQWLVGKDSWVRTGQELGEIETVAKN